MTSIPEIRLQAFDELRQAADALTLIQSPIGRPSSDPDIRNLIMQRDQLIFRTVQEDKLSISQIALATGLSRQRVYAILSLQASLQRGLQDSRNGRTRPLPLPEIPADIQLPETDV